MIRKGNIKFEIINNIGVISSGSKGWKTELNVVSWNGGDPKYDIRAWNEDHSMMGKGITLSEDELRSLYKLLISEVSYLDSEE
ncbi:MAG: PC4/YdbC family ssDNA-binding protein [Galactobacillus timonensis]|uniref:YdbC family protein n=1 Tax=Galactobacillus timonensis TaxID=2041840 RepID=UPI002409971D|nr:PC4/YdbC family ssDNA-binding protein [Galactobacillus timonensis]MDD5852238.1 PC4/YdbC family ssDNA-binding protein [Galactobacillus timonensis]MDD6369344.1 PC4/YdbC family ssDNA-binding protein [Galactobacillus timonensis]MDD6598849.1 PC4/YdbC family ssDNA-binding protein [Galactobacillus timonensis]MDD6680611.1 PC4/YdbC family ssDNA-binding protein [Galactobacillus timonensis]